MKSMLSRSPRSASTPPMGIRTMLAVASASATMASQAVECVRSHAVHETATACTKKLCQEMIEPIEYQRKLRSAKTSAMPPKPSVKAQLRDPPAVGCALLVGSVGERDFR